MPARKYLEHNAGMSRERAATVVSTGASNAGDLVAFDDTGKLDLSALPSGIGPDIEVVTATEALSAGNFVNVYDVSGSPRCRKADASSTAKRAHGYVLASVASGGQASIYFEGTNAQVSGLTTGDVYLSSTTPGAATTTVPTTAGGLVQLLGVAVSATRINVEIDTPIGLAS